MVPEKIVNPVVGSQGEGVGAHSECTWYGSTIGALLSRWHNLLC